MNKAEREFAARQLAKRIKRLQDDIFYDRLLISRIEAQRQLKALIAEFEELTKDD